MPVTIYTGQNFVAASKIQLLYMGRYPKAKLTIGAGTLRSLQVPAGVEVTLYSQDNFSGERFVCTANCPTLPTFDMKTSSILVLPATFPPPGTTLPTDYNNADLVASAMNMVFTGLSFIPAFGWLASFAAGVLPIFTTSMTDRITEAAKQITTDVMSKIISDKLVEQEALYRTYVGDRNKIPNPDATQKVDFNRRIGNIYDTLINEVTIFTAIPYVDVSLPYYLRHLMLTVSVTLEMVRMNNSYDEQTQLSDYFTKAQAYLRAAIKGRLRRESDKVTSTQHNGTNVNWDSRIKVMRGGGDASTTALAEIRAVYCREYFMRNLIRYQRMLDVHNGIVEVWSKFKGPTEKDKFKVFEWEFNADAHVADLPKTSRFTALPSLEKRADGGFNLKFSHTGCRWWAVYTGNTFPNYTDYSSNEKWDWTNDQPGTVTYDLGTNPTGCKMVILFTGSWAVRDFSIINIDEEKILNRF